MKISKYLGTFAFLAMLAACSTEEEQVRFAGDEVKVNATIGGESVFTRRCHGSNSQTPDNQP